MRLALCGYGRMGREIERIAVERGHTVVTRIDPADPGADVRSAAEAPLADCDAVIEFSQAPAVVANARVYAKAGVSAIIGTTGWDAERDAVRTIVEASSIGYLVGSNFSVGANLFFRIVSEAAGLLRPFDEYDVALIESHHNRKADSPSGTALTAARAILAALPRKTALVDETLRRPPEAHELHVASLRIGSDPGTHTVVLDSAADTIEIRHRARNRSGFALGSVRAAEWLAGRSGFCTVDDMMNDLIHRGEA